MIKKKFVIINTTLLLSIGSLISAPTTFANYNNSEITKIEKRLQETREELSDLEEQIKRVDKAIKDNDRYIAETEANIKEQASELAIIEEEIDGLNKKISQRTEVLKGRVLSLQESGGNIGYIEVLFGSRSFSDFVDRLFAIVQITNADTELINEQEMDKQLVENKQLTVNRKIKQLEEEKIELEAMKEHNLEQKENNEKLKKKLKKQEKSDLSKKSELEAAERRARQSTRQVSRGSSNSNNYTAPAVSYTGDISAAITAGYKYIGRSAYKFAGGRTAYDIENGLFDCSGFVSWAYRQAGISLPASTGSLRYVGKRVSPSDMRPGDLVFFNTYKTDGHVVIYIGGGQFIGSQNNTGVAIASMNQSYWKNRFTGHVRRVN